MDETTSTTNGERSGGRSDGTNVSGPERWGSVGAGAALALFGMRRGGFPGAMLVLSGGGLLLRGITGHCYAYEMLGMSSAEPKGYESTGWQGERGTAGPSEGSRPWDRDEPGSQSKSFELRATEDRISGRPVETERPESWRSEAEAENEP